MNNKRQKEYNELGLPIGLIIDARVVKSTTMGEQLKYLTDDQLSFVQTAANAYHAQQDELDEFRRTEPLKLAELHAQQEEIEHLNAYADKLANGLPDGMLPKDVENLRDTNVAFIGQIERLRSALEIIVDASAAYLSRKKFTPRHECDGLNFAYKNAKFELAKQGKKNDR